MSHPFLIDSANITDAKFYLKLLTIDSDNNSDLFSFGFDIESDKTASRQDMFLAQVKLLFWHYFYFLKWSYHFYFILISSFTRSTKRNLQFWSQQQNYLKVGRIKVLIFSKTNIKSNYVKQIMTHAYNYVKSNFGAIF